MASRETSPATGTPCSMSGASCLPGVAVHRALGAGRPDSAAAIARIPRAVQRIPLLPSPLIGGYGVRADLDVASIASADRCGALYQQAEAQPGCGLDAARDGSEGCGAGYCAGAAGGLSRNRQDRPGQQEGGLAGSA